MSRKIKKEKPAISHGHEMEILKLSNAQNKDNYNQAKTKQNKNTNKTKQPKEPMHSQAKKRTKQQI